MKGTSSGLTKTRSAGLIAAGVIVGGVLAGTIGANAASSGGTSSGTPGMSGRYGSSTAPAPPANAFGAAPVRSDEKQATGPTATTLTQKAEAKVSGATAYRVETDAGDGYYEVHVKKSDGSLVTVKFDKNLTITAVEDGMGKGDPGHSFGDHGGVGPGALSGAPVPSGTAG
ncbi:MAG TPA: hypothetical protein VFJ17_02075 [Mycobacteriales bacterium]|jgi:hypothetical protein|nr:hypothetical protein [Mycobacteriales bacterium]